MDNYLKINEFNQFLKHANFPYDFKKCTPVPNKEEDYYDCINKEFETSSKGIELNYLSSVHLIIEKVKEKDCNNKMMNLLV